MIKLLLKKKKGESVVSGAAMLAMGIIAVYLMIVMITNYYKTLSAVEDVYMTVRNYLLISELEGCLSADKAESLYNDLSELGVTNIKISGKFEDSARSLDFIEVSSSEFVMDDDTYGAIVTINVTGVLQINTRKVNVFGGTLDIGSPKATLNIHKKGISVK